SEPLFLMTAQERGDSAPCLIILIRRVLRGRRRDGLRDGLLATLRHCRDDRLLAAFLGLRHLSLFLYVLADRLRKGSRIRLAHDVVVDLAAGLLLLSRLHGEQGALDAALAAVSVIALREAGSDDD